MTLAYVDTSIVVAIALGEPGSGALRKKLLAFDQLTSAGLLEAEFRCALRRSGVGDASAEDHLRHILFVHPSRRLTLEIDRVLSAGFLRGADLWHVACALFLSPSPRALTFLTLDREQKDAARKLGFRLQ